MKIYPIFLSCGSAMFTGPSNPATPKKEEDTKPNAVCEPLSTTIPASCSFTPNTTDDLETTLKSFKTLVGEMQAIKSLLFLAEWDLLTKMPEKASEERAWQTSEANKFLHHLFTSDKMGRFLSELLKEENFKILSKVDQKLVTEVSKEYQKAKKLPSSLVKELSETTSSAYNVWVSAKKNNNFNAFAPYLEKIFSLTKQKAECYGYKCSPYNALLDDYEVGMTTEKLIIISGFFGGLSQKGTIPFFLTTFKGLMGVRMR